MQGGILELHNTNSKEFVKFIGRIVVGSENKSHISWERIWISQGGAESLAFNHSELLKWL